LCLIFLSLSPIGNNPPSRVTFHSDTATAVLVIFGRLKPADAIADGRVHVEGESALVDAFGQSFQGG
jgi:hypothetical protein